MESYFSVMKLPDSAKVTKNFNNSKTTSSGHSSINKNAQKCMGFFNKENIPVKIINN